MYTEKRKPVYIEYERWCGYRGRLSKHKVSSKKARSYYDPPWHKRWTGHPGSGKYCKRNYSRARRRVSKSAVKGIRPRHSIRVWSSECNWKGH